jgi:AraC-like DNA-binding protein
VVKAVADATQGTRDALWRVNFAARERHLPGERYWWDNSVRHPVHVLFQYTVSGQLYFRDFDGSEHMVGPGHAVLFCWDEPTVYGLRADASEPYCTEWLDLGGVGLFEHWQAIRAKHGSVVAVPPKGPLWSAMHRLMKLADPRQRTSPETTASTVHAFVMLLFASLNAKGFSTRGPIERAIDDLLNNPTAPWSLKRLADQHGCSREHLSREFRRRVGRAPAAWLNAARVARAVHLLTQSSLPIAEVKKQAGFSSPHTFSRQVKIATGASPRRLRQGRLGKADSGS